jgi:hypothetical protein
MTLESQVEVLLDGIRRSNADQIKFTVHMCNLPGAVRVLHTPYIKLEGICSDGDVHNSSILCIDCGNEVRVIIPWKLCRRQGHMMHLLDQILRSPLFLCALCYIFPPAAVLLLVIIHLMADRRLSLFLGILWISSVPYVLAWNLLLSAFGY